jgi:hypothetical protein
VTGFDIAALLGAAALLIGVGVFFNRRGNARRSATHS